MPLTRPEALLNITGGDTHLFDELATLFVQSIPQYCDALTNALLKEDVDSIALTLHKIKGTLQLVGADQTLQLLDAMYSHARTHHTLADKDGFTALLSQLNTIMTEVSAYPKHAQDPD